MIIKLIQSEGAVDLSKRVTSIQWSGSSGRIARELVLQLVVSATDPDFAALDIQLFRPIALYQEDGTQLICAYVLKVSRDSGGEIMTVTAMDRGLWLANNQGWYNFAPTTAESATKAVCGDFGIKVGALPGTGVKLKRKFPGTALHDILRTLWYKAGEENGKRYHLSFVGDALSVVEKPLSAGSTLAPKVNLEGSSITRDGTGYHNTVAVYSDKGGLVRTIASDTAQFDLEGKMQRVMTQRDGVNIEKEAKAALLDDDVKQMVSVTAEGDSGLVTGQAVQVQLTTSGVAGLFWIESDTHSWRGGKYTTSLNLNFRKLMAQANAGAEP